MAKLVEYGAITEANRQAYLELYGDEPEKSETGEAREEHPPAPPLEDLKVDSE